MSDIRVRYGRNNKGQRKNCLVTERNGNVVYFGISRCNKKDTFDKLRGRDIACGRMFKEGERLMDIADNDPDFPVVSAYNGLAGYCGVNNIKDLLKYFDNIDKRQIRGFHNSIDFIKDSIAECCKNTICDPDGCNDACECQECECLKEEK